MIPGDALLNSHHTLTCPFCDSDFLHQQHITARWRDNEDKAGHEVISGRTHTGRQPIEEGFRGRRDDIEITFLCEECAQRSRLVIVQHKGMTLIWLESPATPTPKAF